MTVPPISLLQITDCHLGEQEGDTLLSMNPDESLRDVLSLIQQNHEHIDFLIATGDLCNEGTLPAYKRLHNVLSEQVSSPFAWLPGNHDSPRSMAEFGHAVNTKLQVLGNWLIILLNSRVEGCIYGHLESDELQFLERAINDHPGKHVMICMHHQPVPIGSQWMDNYIVRNAHEFWDIVGHFSNVKAVVWGHVHQEFSDTHHHIQLLASPSTCIQFTPYKKDFHVENTMPGYRWFELYDDGQIVTGVERVEDKDYGTDVNSHGY